MNAETLDTYVCGYCAAEQSAEAVPCTCPHCGHFGPMRDFPTREVLTTARQNDAFRTGMVVGGCPFPGSVVVTSGVSDRGRDFVTGAILAAAFDRDFSEDNDPWGTAASASSPCRANDSTGRSTTTTPSVNTAPTIRAIRPGRTAS